MAETSVNDKGESSISPLIFTFVIIPFSFHTNAGTGADFVLARATER